MLKFKLNSQIAKKVKKEKLIVNHKMVFFQNFNSADQNNIKNGVLTKDGKQPFRSLGHNPHATCHMHIWAQLATMQATCLGMYMALAHAYTQIFQISTHKVAKPTWSLHIKLRFRKKKKKHIIGKLMQQETHPCSYFVQHNMLMGSKIAQNYSKNMKRLEKQAIKISFYTNQLCSTKFWAQNFDIVWNISCQILIIKQRIKKACH